MKYISVDDLQAYCDNQKDHSITPNEFQRMNHIEIVRCKDCIYWKPPHVRLNDGKQRAYKESDRVNNPYGMKDVMMDVGINVGGKCWVDHNAGYSDDKRVFRSRNDFCSRSCKLPDGETSESFWGLTEEPSELIDD